MDLHDKNDFELHQQPITARPGYAYDADLDQGRPDGKGEDGIRTGTSHDAQDMHRMGRRQQLRRNFKSVSILGLAAVTMATWIAILMANIFSLINGGLAGTIWVYFGSWLCTITLVASLAEMASIAPTSGGQYREFDHLPVDSPIAARLTIRHARLGLGVCASLFPEVHVLRRWMAIGSGLAGSHRWRLLLHKLADATAGVVQ